MAAIKGAAVDGETRGPRVAAAAASARDNQREGGERRMREEERELSAVSGE